MEYRYIRTDQTDLKALTRRAFLKVGAFAVASARLAPALLLAGLGVGCNVFQDIESWVPTGIDAFNAVLNLLEGSGVITVAAGSPIAAVVGVIFAAFNQLKTDAQQYLATNPPPVGALAKVLDVLQNIGTNFQSFLTAININDPKLSALVTGMVQIILGVVSGFENQLPQTAPTTAKRIPARLTMGSGAAAKVITITPVNKPSKAEFRKQWNTLVTSGGHPELKLH